MSTQDPGPPRAQPTPEPRRLGGRYELGAVLGYGGMAVVRKATDLRLGRTVAVKMLRGELTESVAFQGRFRREARAAAALNHPSIVSVYDAGEETVDGEATFYIVMEYVEGQTLRDLVRNGPQPADRALEITEAVLDALEESHRRGIVHRDVKPANVMLTPAGAVKVMDFGVARALADMSAALTQTAVVIGTAHYLSPEQARGDSVDARSDVYSTGCLLYELLTGRPPFDGDSAVAVAYQHVRETPRAPSVLTPGVTPDVDSIVLAALAKQPGERYQSAGQMRDAITAVLAGEQAPLAVPPLETTADLPLVTGPSSTTATVQSPAAAAGLHASGPASAGGAPRRARLVVAAAAALLVLGLGGLAVHMVGDDPETGPAGQRSARTDQGGPAGTRSPQGGTVEPTGSTGGDGSPGQAGRPPAVADAPTGGATDDDRPEVATQNRSSVGPTADRQTEASDAPTSTATTEPTTPGQSAPPADEPTQTPPETTASEPPVEPAEPEPTPTEETPPAPPSTSQGGSS